jgi:hypothetical protein
MIGVPSILEVTTRIRSKRSNPKEQSMKQSFREKSIKLCDPTKSKAESLLFEYFMYWYYSLATELDAINLLFSISSVRLPESARFRCWFLHSKEVPCASTRSNWK